MKYHKYNPQTFLYETTIEADSPPANSTTGNLPEETEFYTIAFIDKQWVSVLRPTFKIVDNEIILSEDA